MNENNEIYTENITGSVSDNQIFVDPASSSDALPDVSENPVEEILEESVKGTGSEVDDFLEEDTVSGSDVRTFFDSAMEGTVSSGDVYNITYETSAEIPIWKKPFSNYTVTEGLLLLIFILLLLFFLIRTLKLN